MGKNNCVCVCDLVQGCAQLGSKALSKRTEVFIYKPGEWCALNDEHFHGCQRWCWAVWAFTGSDTMYSTCATVPPLTRTVAVWSQCVPTESAQPADTQAAAAITLSSSTVTEAEAMN